MDGGGRLMGQTLSNRDAGRVQKVVRAAERHADTRYYRRKNKHGGGGGGAGVVWAEVTATLTHAAVDEYTVQRVSAAGVKDGTDIVIDRAMGYEGRGTNGTDLRNFAPWFTVGAVLPIVQHYDAAAEAQKWFIDLPMRFIGQPAYRSLDVNTDSNCRTMAVWK